MLVNNVLDDEISPCRALVSVVELKVSLKSLMTCIWLLNSSSKSKSVSSKSETVSRFWSLVLEFELVSDWRRLTCCGDKYLLLFSRKVSAESIDNSFPEILSIDMFGVGCWVLVWLWVLVLVLVLVLGSLAIAVGLAMRGISS